MKKLILHSKKEHFVKRMHPWIFSGAIKTVDTDIEEGAVVEVQNSKGQFVALGHYQEGSIAVRILSFSNITIDKAFWKESIDKAIEYRRCLGLPDKKNNCYRLVHGAGDALPGLIIDIYGNVAVVQCHSIGMHKVVETIANVLTESIKGVTAVYDKSNSSLPFRYASSITDEFLVGESGEQEVMENGNKFIVDFETGQKTGFFLDQRDNRNLLSNYVKGKRVLNTFCYSGGFSVYALKAGAKVVHSVDLSSKAIEWTNKNVQLNNLAGEHDGFTGDVLEYLKTSEVYDVMVVDPPAYAKNPRKRHNAVQGYKRLNALAMKKIAPGGVLFTFSCSQVVDRQLFYDTIVAAAIEVGRKVKVMHHLSQSPDHPVNIFHPEGAYLKGLVLRIEE